MMSKPKFNPKSGRLKEIAITCEESLLEEYHDMYKFINDYAHQEKFTRCELLELYDVNNNSPEDDLASFFLDIMGYR